MTREETKKKLQDTLLKDVYIQDFCDMDLFEQMIENWSISTGLAAVAIDSEGDYVSKYHNFTDFCQNLTRKTPEGLRRCTECDKTGKGTYLCHAGLVDFASAITLEDGTVLGNMLGGQVLPQQPDEEKYRTTAKELGIDPEAYIDALRKVNVRTPKEIEAAAKLLSDVVNMFVRTSWSAKQDAKTLSERANIIFSLSKIFLCNYFLDVKNDVYREIEAIPGIQQIVAKEGKASAALAETSKYFVEEEFQAGYRKFTDGTTIKQRIGNKHSITFEFLGKHLGWCRATFIVVKRDKEGEISHLLFAIQGIEEEKQQELLTQKKLKKAADEANRANRVKSDFLARMSHDMRTPLTTIMGLCDMGQERFKDEEALRYFKIIRNSSGYLLSILTDILDMQKMTTGNVKLQPGVCHDAVTCGAVEQFIRPRAEAKNIQLITDFKCQVTNCYFNIDTRRVQQIITNLLTNAVKYTKAGGMIHWNCCVVSNDEKETIIRHTISDNGVGMSAEFMKIMYEPFTQVVDSPGDNGHGLGLAIVKKLVDLMGATIECQSELGKGTTFILTVPHTKASAEEIAAYERKRKLAENAETFYGRKILVCEDNDINAEIIKNILQNRKIEVEIASDGGQGVELARNNKYDAILMDIRMPVLDGYAATRKIREFNKTIPIVALSANDFPEDIEQSFASGMNAHLAKPIDVKQLFAALQEVLTK